MAVIHGHWHRRTEATGGRTSEHSNPTSGCFRRGRRPPGLPVVCLDSGPHEIPARMCVERTRLGNARGDRSDTEKCRLPLGSSVSLLLPEQTTFLGVENRMAAHASRLAGLHRFRRPSRAAHAAPTPADPGRRCFTSSGNESGCEWIEKLRPERDSLNGGDLWQLEQMSGTNDRANTRAF